MNVNPSFWRLLLNLPKLLRLIIRLIRDPRVPVSAKIIFFLGVAYVIWPLDLIPDYFVPVIGSFDDLALLLAGMRYLFLRTPPAVLQEHLYEMQVNAKVQ